MSGRPEIKVAGGTLVGAGAVETASPAPKKKTPAKKKEVTSDGE